MKDQISAYEIEHQTPTDVLFGLQDFLNIKTTRPKLVAVVGPTCSGKTGLSVEIAKWANGEVVSMDSRQVYQEMDIGTAKVTTNEMQGVPHHLIDAVAPDEDFTLVDYKEQALAAIKDINSRGKVPLLVGGTGLYYSAIVDNFQVPKVPANNDLRLELEVLAQNEGVEAVHKILALENPTAAKKIHQNNLRYVIRAIEIARSPAAVSGGKGEKLFDTFTIAIDWPREVLYNRINQRVYGLIEDGLLAEVQKLLDKGLTRENSVAMASHGYQEIVPHLKGEKSLAECIDEVQKNTRHYAKRQYTWFRKYADINWLPGQKIKEMIDLLATK